MLKMSEDIAKIRVDKLTNYDSPFTDVYTNKIFLEQNLALFFTSEAAVERGFSKHKAIPYKFRARLGSCGKYIFGRQNHNEKPHVTAEATLIDVVADEI